MKIKFLSVGGTIDKVYFDKLSEYQVGLPRVQDILSALPIAFEFEVESILRKDSLDVDDEDRRLIKDVVAAEPCEHIVMTHGTDTMIETAQALSIIEGKCIVLTGSLQPADFKSSDAVFNIGVAVGAVMTKPHGVYIAMSGYVLDPFKCRKNRELKIFEAL